MACIHPLRAFATGALTDKGKPVYFVTTHKFEYVTCDDFIKRKLPWRYTFVRDFIEIPCGHCIGCKQDRQYSWAFRCMAEAQYHRFNYFLTLTYDDLHLPALGSLQKRDLQLFNKRLRKNFGPFRFFACGEYGGVTNRPHYHGIYFFDQPLLDMRLWSHHGNYDLYNSQTLDSSWQNGFSVVGTLTPSAASYCAKYVIKGSNITQTMEPAFIVMSRKPAIGDRFFMENKDAASLVLPSGSGSYLRGGFARYFKNKFELGKCDKDLLAFRENSAFIDSCTADMDTFRDLQDYLLKHPFQR